MDKQYLVGFESNDHVVHHMVHGQDICGKAATGCTVSMDEACVEAARIADASGLAVTIFEIVPCRRLVVEDVPAAAVLTKGDDDETES